MKKIALLLALSLAPVAAACPVKAGYAANGLSPKLAGVTAECGALYGAFSKPLKSTGAARWVELYQVPSSRAGTAATTLRSGLISKGYTLAFQKDIENGSQFGFAKGDKVVMVQIFAVSGMIFLGIAGN